MAGRMSTKNSNDTIGNRTRNLPVCSGEPLSNNRGKTTTKLTPNIQYRIRVPNKGPPNRRNCQVLSHRSRKVTSANNSVLHAELIRIRVSRWSLLAYSLVRNSKHGDLQSQMVAVICNGNVKGRKLGPQVLKLTSCCQQHWNTCENGSALYE